MVNVSISRQLPCIRGLELWLFVRIKSSTQPAVQHIIRSVMRRCRTIKKIPLYRMVGKLGLLFWTGLLRVKTMSKLSSICRGAAISLLTFSFNVEAMQQMMVTPFLVINRTSHEIRICSREPGPGACSVGILEPGGAYGLVKPAGDVPPPTADVYLEQYLVRLCGSELIPIRSVAVLESSQKAETGTWFRYGIYEKTYTERCANK